MTRFLDLLVVLIPAEEIAPVGAHFQQPVTLDLGVAPDGAHAETAPARFKDLSE